MTLIRLFITAVSPLTARRAISHLYRQPQVPHCHFRQPSSFSLLRVITVSMSKQIHQLTFESHNINHHTMWHTLSSALFHFWWFADEQNHATFSYPQCECCSLPLLIHTLSSPPCWIWCGHCRSYDQVGLCWSRNVGHWIHSILYHKCYGSTGPSVVQWDWRW